MMVCNVPLTGIKQTCSYYKVYMISIIINCYNGEAYLKKALDSVIAQDYQNWELIFWDNMSIDGSAKIFKSFKDKRFKYFLSKQHDLLYAARNKAIEKSNGSFLAFLDVDDYWEPKKLSKQINLFIDPKIGVVYSNFWIKNEINGKIRKFSYFKLPRGNVNNKLLRKYKVGLLTLIVRKSAFKEIGFNNEFHIIGDFDLCLRLSLNWNFAVVNECLATYRWHDKNESVNNLMLQAQELMKWKEAFNKYLNEINLKHVDDKILRIEFQHYLSKKLYKDCFVKIKLMNLFVNKFKSFIQIFQVYLFRT